MAACVLDSICRCDLRAGRVELVRITLSARNCRPPAVATFAFSISRKRRRGGQVCDKQKRHVWPGLSSPNAAVLRCLCPRTRQVKATGTPHPTERAPVLPSQVALVVAAAPPTQPRAARFPSQTATPNSGVSRAFGCRQRAGVGLSRRGDQRISCKGRVARGELLAPNGKRQRCVQRVARHVASSSRHSVLVHRTGRQRLSKCQ
jgi:hypothetical protein